MVPPESVKQCSKNNSLHEGAGKNTLLIYKGFFKQCPYLFSRVLLSGKLVYPN